MRALRELLRRWWFAVAATLAAVTVPFAGVLTGSRTAMYGDVNYTTVPFFVSVWRSVTGAGSPLWNSNVFAGYSTVGAGQFAVFYPFNFVFGWLEPANAYRWWFLFHLWVAGLAALAWAWHRWTSRPGAVVAGVGYALTGYVVFHLIHPAFLAAAAWLPLVFLGIDLRWSAGRRVAPWWARSLGLIGVLGQPQLLWVAVVGAVAYSAAWWDAHRLGALAGRPPRLRGVGLAAIQLLPQFVFAHQRPSHARRRRP
jgi:hypothetical protein